MEKQNSDQSALEEGTSTAYTGKDSKLHRSHDSNGLPL